MTISGARTIVGTVGAGNQFRVVRLFSGSDNVVQGNSVFAIQLAFAAANHVVADNSVSGGGIEIQQNGPAVIERNDVVAFSGRGIQVFASTAGTVVTIRDNTVRLSSEGIVAGNGSPALFSSPATDRRRTCSSAPRT